MDRSFSVDETSTRVDNLPEQQATDAAAEVISKLYNKHPLLRAIVVRVPSIGGSADVLLTARAQQAFEGYVREQLDTLRSALLAIDPTHTEGVESRLAELENRLQSLDIADEPDWIDESVDFQKLSAVFVAPTQYASALQVLQTQRRLLLTGPPHIGKSTMALKLASDIKAKESLQAIVRLQPEDPWQAWEQMSNLVIILDDSFGGKQLDNRSRANQWSEITARLRKNNYVIATSRTQVLDQAEAQTKLGEDRTLSNYLIELQQETSYDDTKLLDILHKHLEYASNGSTQLLTSDQYTWASDKEWQIIRRLRFPHNIDRFTAVHLPNAASYAAVDSAIEQARYIEAAVQKWVQELPRSDRWFVLILALFPRVPANALDKIYQRVAEIRGFAPDDITQLVLRHSAYVGDSSRPGLRHVTYEEAVIKVLQDHYKTEVGRIVDYGLQIVLETDIQSFARCLQADYGWPRYDEATLANGFPLDTYLEQFANSYAYLRSIVFAGIKPLIQPCHCPDNGVVAAIVSENRGLMSMALIPGEADSPAYAIFTSKNVRQDTDSLMNQATENYAVLHVESLSVDDLAQRSPHMHALQHIKNQINYILDRQRLPESQAMRMLRWEKVLRGFGTDAFGKKYLDVDSAAPFGETEYKSLCEQINTLLSGPVPERWYAEAWEDRKRKYKGNFKLLQRLMDAATEDGSYYTGPIIPREDRSEDSYGSYPRLSYSPEQFYKVIHFGISTILESYRWMVEFCFSPIRDTMPHYRKMPLKVVCGATYDADRNFGASHCEMYLLPNDFQTENDQQIEVLVEEITDSYNPETVSASTFSKSARTRLEAADASSLTWERFDPYNFTSGNFIIETVYKWLQNDLDEAMGWQDIGQERSNHLLRAIEARVEEENRITGQNVLPAVHSFTLVDPWQVEDWEN